MSRRTLCLAAKFRKVTHCIFDLDGTLLDTEPIHQVVMEKLTSEYGHAFTSELYLKTLGRSDVKNAEITVDLLKLPISPQQFLERYRPMCEERLGTSPLMKGAQRLLCHLYQHKIPMALATSSRAEMFERKVAKFADLFTIFSHRVHGSDPEVKECKPAPDIFLVAAARFPDKPAPAQCLVFEDSPNGVSAAISAGMQTVMLPDERIPEDLRKDATLVLRTLEDFKPEEFCLPPFPKQSIETEKTTQV